MAIQVIPSCFRFQDPSRYPSDNVEDFEWWCTRNLNPIGERIYLPITWTAYYKKQGFGQRIQELQNFLNTLDTSKKYFSICQYDNGILNDISHLDLRQYNMGAPGDYQLPLICQPHAYTPGNRIKKDIFCSFVGRVTHPIRERIVEQLTGKDGYYISTKTHGLLQFCEILARSRYVLCPRGYGATSFRICEALQYNAMPVYISDKFLLPHQLMGSFICCHESAIGTVEKRMGECPPINNIDTYNNYFTYTANKDLILKDLKANQ